MVSTFRNNIIWGNRSPNNVGDSKAEISLSNIVMCRADMPTGAETLMKILTLTFRTIFKDRDLHVTDRGDSAQCK
ncbi:MAG: hypothetical protein IPM96_15805 [Ignavibacteria bacterium]|nr:hypothetical protein [Ignavibacteria bacterium]